MLVSEERQGRRLEMISSDKWGRPSGFVVCPAFRRRQKSIVCATLAGLALAITLQAQVCPADAKPGNLNLTFKDIHGKPIALSDYKGKVILLDFWATWCPPCRKEIPGYIELYNKYSSRGFVVIGISMDDSASDVKKFAKQIKMNYPILMGAGRDDLEPTFGELPLPTAFVIARDGRICVKHDGLTTKEQIERDISVLF
jgi:peroxiredoxin